MPDTLPSQPCNNNNIDPFCSPALFRLSSDSLSSLRPLFPLSSPSLRPLSDFSSRQGYWAFFPSSLKLQSLKPSLENIFSIVSHMHACTPKTEMPLVRAQALHCQNSNFRALNRQHSPPPGSPPPRLPQYLGDRIIRSLPPAPPRPLVHEGCDLHCHRPPCRQLRRLP